MGLPSEPSATKVRYAEAVWRICPVGSRGRSPDYKLLKGFRFFPHNCSVSYATLCEFCVAHKLIIWRTSPITENPTLEMSCEDLTSNEQLKLYFFTFFLGACCLTANDLVKRDFLDQKLPVIKKINLRKNDDYCNFWFRKYST